MMTTATRTTTPQIVLGYNQARPIPHKNRFGLLLFLGLLLTTLVDFNQLALMTTGIDSFLSPLMLLFCIGIFFCFEFRFGESLGRIRNSYLMLAIGHLTIGTLVAFVFSSTEVYLVYYYIRLYAPSLLIVLACSLGAYHAAQVWGLLATVRVVFFVLSIHILGMILGAVYSDVLYSQRRSVSAQTGQEVRLTEVEGRQSGFFANPNETGMVMVFLAAVGMVCLVGEGRHKWIYVAGIACAAVGCLVTFSRSSILTFAIVIAVQLAIGRLLARWGVLLVAVGAFSALGWLIVGGAEKIGQLNEEQSSRLESISEVLQGNVNEKNTGHRLVAAAVGLHHWAKKPIFGHGIGHGSAIRSKDTAVGWMLGPHNEYIFMLIEWGVVGLSAYLFFLWSLFRSVMKCKSLAAQTLGAGYLAVLLCDSMVSHNVMSQNTHASMMGICFALLAASRVSRVSPRVVPRSAHLGVR